MVGLGEGRAAVALENVSALRQCTARTICGSPTGRGQPHAFPFRDELLLRSCTHRAAAACLRRSSHDRTLAEVGFYGTVRAAPG